MISMSRSPAASTATWASPTFVKFCKIGALSATGTRPYAEGADGFVMGEGAAIFLLKRLADAERDGDKIYAVLRGIGGSSDGKGKGITAPNPVGQKLAIERAWQNAGLSPATATLMEGHGTSTRVGDVVEVQSMADVLGELQPSHRHRWRWARSSRTSGTSKAAAGAAATLKVALSLRDKVLPPSVNCARTNPDIDFAHSPLYVNTELRPWTVPHGWRAPRRIERVWFRRHQLPYRAGGIHPWQTERQRQALGGRGRNSAEPANKAAWLESAPC